MEICRSHDYKLFEMSLKDKYKHKMSINTKLQCTIYLLSYYSET